MRSGTNIKLSTDVPQALRPRFDAAYKLQMLEEADQCASTGELGELLRREGLSSSHLMTWRKQRQAGSLVALGPKKQRSKSNHRDPMTAEVERLELEQELQVTQERLRHMEAIFEAQIKLALLLEPDSP